MGKKWSLKHKFKRKKKKYISEIKLNKTLNTAMSNLLMDKNMIFFGDINRK